MVFGERINAKGDKIYIGDFVLRNEHIQALVSGNLPLRRANMSTEYAFPTPGSLYDLDMRGADNDQLFGDADADELNGKSRSRISSS